MQFSLKFSVIALITVTLKLKVDTVEIENYIGVLIEQILKKAKVDAAGKTVNTSFYLLKH